METAYLLILILSLSSADIHTSATKSTSVPNSSTSVTRPTIETPMPTKIGSAPQTTNATTTRTSNISATKSTNVTLNSSTAVVSTRTNNATHITTSIGSATNPSTVAHTLNRNTSVTRPTSATHMPAHIGSATQKTDATTTRTSNISAQTSTNTTLGETSIKPTTEPSLRTSKIPVPPIVSENTRKRYIVEIDLDQTKAELELSVSVPLNFTEDLRKKTSELFIKLEYEFKQQLTEVFKLIPGFLSIDILQFVNGSVVADLRVNFRPDLTVIQHAIKFIANNASMLLQGLNIFGQHPKILQRNSSYSYQLEDGSMGSLCSFLAPTTCPFGYTCQQYSGGTLYCEDRCSLNRTFCHNDGECYLDHRDGRLKCRCLDTNSDYYFSGENCEFIKPKGNSSPSALSVKDYAIIGGVAAAAIVVVIVLFLGGRALRKACVNSKDVDTGKDDESFRSNISVTHASVHMSHMDGSNPHERHGIDNTAHVFDSGLPQVPINDQKLYSDSQTNRDSQAKHEAFIYQPTNMNGPLSGSSKELDSPEPDRNSGHTYYNVMDFEQNVTKKKSSKKTSKNYNF